MRICRNCENELCVNVLKIVNHFIYVNQSFIYVNQRIIYNRTATDFILFNFQEKLTFNGVI